MNKCRILFNLCICLALPVITVHSQTITQLTFPSNTVPAPVCIALEPINLITESALSVPEISEKLITDVPFRVKHFNNSFPWFIVKKGNAANQERVFEQVKKADHELPTASVIIIKSCNFKKINSNP